MPRRAARFLRVAVAVVLGALPAASSAQQVVPSPPSPTSRVAWQHDGVGVQWFEVRVDGQPEARVEPGAAPPDRHHETPLPLMVPGLRTITVAACNDSGCATSAPLQVRVVSGPIRWLPNAAPGQ